MLYLSDPIYRMVGKGIRYIESTPTLHNCPLPSDYVKVRVDFASEEDALLPVPIEDAEIMTVGQALGTYVAWPSILVVSDFSLTQLISYYMLATCIKLCGHCLIS